VIEAKQCRLNKDKKGNSTQDPDSNWNWKVKVKVNSDSKRKSTDDYTAGNVHDSNCFTNLLSGEESAVYADSAYSSGTHSEWLATRNIENRLIRRATETSC
jgi:IS5 family transposase